MTQVNMLEAKSDLSKLIKMLELHQEDVIYLARNGTPVAQLTLIPKKNAENASAQPKGNLRYRMNSAHGIKKWRICSPSRYEDFIRHTHSALGNF